MAAVSGGGQRLPIRSQSSAHSYWMWSHMHTQTDRRSLLTTHARSTQMRFYLLQSNSLAATQRRRMR